MCLANMSAVLEMTVLNVIVILSRFPSAPVLSGLGVD